MYRALRSLGQDASVLKQQVKPGTLRRTGRFVVLDAAVGVLNPLLYRAIIDHGILERDPALIVRLAAVLAGLAVVDAGLGLAADRPGLDRGRAHCDGVARAFRGSRAVCTAGKIGAKGRGIPTGGPLPANETARPPSKDAARAPLGSPGPGPVRAQAGCPA